MLRSLIATLPLIIVSSTAFAQSSDNPQPQSFAYADLQAQTKPLTGLQFESQFDGRDLSVTGIVLSVDKDKMPGQPATLSILLDVKNGQPRSPMTSLNISVSCDVSPDGPYANTALGLSKGDTVTLSGKARARARLQRKRLSLGGCKINS